MPPIYTPFTLNKNSPLANKLTFLLTWMGSGSTGAPVDLVKGRKINVTATTMPHKVVSDPTLGRVLKVGDTNTSLQQELLNWGTMSEFNTVVNLSMAVWFKQNVANTQLLIGSQDGNAGYEGVCIEHWGDGNFYFQVSPDGSAPAATYTLNDTSLHLLAMAYDGSQSSNTARLKCYIDGVLINPSYPGVPTQTGTYVANWHIYGSNMNSNDQDNLVGSVMLWNRTLTPQEMWRLYDPATRFDLYKPVIPKLYWQLGIPVDNNITIVPVALSAIAASVNPTVIAPEGGAPPLRRRPIAIELPVRQLAI